MFAIVIPDGAVGDEPESRILDPSSFLRDDRSIYWVLPRLGTISPWSTKATDIAHICDLSSVDRIERGIQFQIESSNTEGLDKDSIHKLKKILHDPLLESFITDPTELNLVFKHHQPRSVRIIPFLEKGQEELIQVNRELGLALSNEETNYLIALFRKLNRNPTDVELMMFATILSTVVTKFLMRNGLSTKKLVIGHYFQ